MSNFNQMETDDDGVTVDFHLLQTSRYGWELTLPREQDAIKIIIDKNGVAVYRDKSLQDFANWPLPKPTDSDRSEFMDRWILL